MTRKTHLEHTTHGGPTCQTGRVGAALRGEHITVKLDEFALCADAHRCTRCKGSKLFAFLKRQSDKVLVDAWIPEASDAWIAADAALIAANRARRAERRAQP
jgi:hypothetical protein